MRDLADAGYQHDRETIAGSLWRKGLRAKAAKKFKATTNSKHNLPMAPNLLQQDFTTTGPISTTRLYDLRNTKPVDRPTFKVKY